MAPGAGIVLFCCRFCGRGSHVEECTSAAHWESGGNDDQEPTGGSEKYPDAAGDLLDGLGVGPTDRLGLEAELARGAPGAAAVDGVFGVGMGVEHDAPGRQAPATGGLL